MRSSRIAVDELGTVRFNVYSDHGGYYEFEQAEDSNLLFVTQKDATGRAEVKQVINTAKAENSQIVQIYEDILEEQEYE